MSISGEVRVPDAELIMAKGDVMASEHSLQSDELTPEKCLLRLFRCMKGAEQEDLILGALQTLGESCRFDPLYRYYRPEAIQEELRDPDLDGRLMQVWPGEWPGQQIVELDNLGDAGEWLARVMGEPISEVLFGSAWNDEAMASSMAEDYLQEMRKQDYPLPSDFGDDPQYDGWIEDDEAQVRADFVAFLRHWRERVLIALGKQNPLTP
jgi:hypothetical protein